MSAGVVFLPTTSGVGQVAALNAVAAEVAHCALMFRKDEPR